jgi:hypothetical protein
LIWRRLQDLLNVQLTRGDVLVMTVLLVIADWRWVSPEGLRDLVASAYAEIRHLLPMRSWHCGARIR